MINYEPMPLFEAYTYLANRTNGFSTEDFYNRRSSIWTDEQRSAMKSTFDAIIKTEKHLDSVLDLDNELLSRLFITNGSKLNGRYPSVSSTVASFFVDGIAAFAHTDRESFFDALHERCASVPSVIVEEVSCKPCEEGKKYEAAEIFGIISASSANQKTKNALIAAALDPHSFVEQLRTALCPVADAFIECRDLWLPAIESYRESYEAGADVKRILEERYNYSTAGIEEYNVFPSIMAFPIALASEHRTMLDVPQLIVVFGVLVDKASMDKSPSRNAVSSTAYTMSVLGEPCRLKMLLKLMEKPAYVGELAKFVELAPCTVSQHLQILAGTGLISARDRDNDRRVYYYINKQKLDEFVGNINRMMTFKEN